MFHTFSFSYMCSCSQALVQFLVKSLKNLHYGAAYLPGLQTWKTSSLCVCVWFFSPLRFIIVTSCQCAYTSLKHSSFVSIFLLPSWSDALLSPTSSLIWCSSCFFFFTVLTFHQWNPLFTDQKHVHMCVRLNTLTCFVRIATQSYWFGGSGIVS